MRLIDADALKEVMCMDCDNRHLCTECPACETVQQIDAMPTIEPIMYDTGSWQTTLTDISPVEYAPIKHGRWIVKTYEHKYENGYWTEHRTECSVCGNKPLYDEYQQRAESNYCPNCGAKMDEVEE